MKKGIFKIMVCGCGLLLSFGLIGQTYENVIVTSIKTESEKIDRIIKTLESSNTIDYTNKKLAWYHHLLSSAYVWKGEMQIAEGHLFKALEYTPQFMCHFTRMNVKRDIPEAHFLERVPKEWYFAYHFEADVLNRFFAYCDACCEGGINKMKKEKLALNKIDSLLVLAKRRDQNYRKERKEQLDYRQEIEDERNRIMLDSIYDEIGFPNRDKINKESLNTIWLIIHHSTDCNWLKKWLKRAFDEIENNKIDIGFYPQTIRRFYGEKNGFCKERDEAFLNYLAEKYSGILEDKK